MFTHAWVVDFEYGPGHQGPAPRCCVARDLLSGTRIRVWEDDLVTMPAAPFDVGPQSLYIGYSMSGDVGCFLSLGWPLPRYFLDAYAEFRVLTNGRVPLNETGLLHALSYFGLPCIEAAEKDSLRQLALRGGPWRDGEPQALLDYCEVDVESVCALIPRLRARLDWPAFTASWVTPVGTQTLLRGAFVAALASVDRAGIPFDGGTLTRLRDAWPFLKADVLTAVNEQFGFWDEKFRFRMSRFEAWLAARGYAWPRTSTGRPCLESDLLDDMAKSIPDLAAFRDARHATNRLRLERIRIDPDGRNRADVHPFGAITGRNSWKASQFAFGPAKWLRHLIVAPPGRCLAYVDWSAQEFAIMAALSGDPGLLEDYTLGDPYLRMAVRFGRAPVSATKYTHEIVRDQFKVVVLATSYGMGPKTLTVKLQVSLTDAEALLDQHHHAYPTFWAWSDRVVDTALLRGSLTTPLGWRITMPKHGSLSSRTLRNWPVQSTASDMMRLALVNLVRAGVSVNAVVHDAYLVEANETEIDAAVRTTQAIMAEASTKVLRGIVTLRSGATIVHPEERYQEPRGSRMWQTAMRLLEELTTTSPDLPTRLGMVERRPHQMTFDLPVLVPQLGAVHGPKPSPAWWST